jgi:hypothetical protein
VMDLLLRLAPLDVRVREVGFVLHYGQRVGQSKMKVLRTIRSTVGLLVRRRIERLLRYRRGQVAATLAAAGPARAGVSGAAPRIAPAGTPGTETARPKAGPS